MPRTREENLAANREYQRKWYANNKDKQKKRVQKNTKKYRQQAILNMKSYLTDKCCFDCGNSDIRVLEFDHVRGEKSRQIGRMVMSGTKWDKILLEIEKCDLVCANCHKIRTYSRIENCWRNGAVA